MQKYYQKTSKSNGVRSSYNLPKTRDGVCIKNLVENKSIRTHWIALYVNSENVIYFDSTGLKHIPKKIRKFIGNKNIKTSIYRMQAFDSIMNSILLYWIYWFHIKRKKFIELYKLN